MKLTDTVKLNDGTLALHAAVSELITSLAGNSIPRMFDLCLSLFSQADLFAADSASTSHPKTFVSSLSLLR